MGRLLILVFLLHLRPCLVRCLLFGSFVGFALLPPAFHGADSCAYGRACPCISGDPADYRAPHRPASSTLGSPAFRLWRRVSCLSLRRLDVGGRGCLRSPHFRIDACLLLS